MQTALRAKSLGGGYKMTRRSLPAMPLLARLLSLVAASFNATRHGQLTEVVPGIVL